MSTSFVLVRLESSGFGGLGGLGGWVWGGWDPFWGGFGGCGGWSAFQLTLACDIRNHLLRFGIFNIYVVHTEDVCWGLFRGDIRVQYMWKCSTTYRI